MCRRVEPADAAPEPVPRPRGARAREAVEPAADQVADRVAAEREQREQRPRWRAAPASRARHRAPASRRPSKKNARTASYQRKPSTIVASEQEVAVGVHAGRTGAPPRRGSAAARPGHRAGGRREEERPVVRLAVVVTRERGSPSGTQMTRNAEENGQVEAPALQVGRVERREVVRAAAPCSGSRRPCSAATNA